MNQQEFLNVCQQHNVDLTTLQKQQFQQYYETLVEWNDKMNLTAITKLEDVFAKHFYDCLLPAIHLELKDEHLCDVGAGAGFPSIPMKISFPHLKVTIVEPLQKRCGFLLELIKQLNLDNVTIENARAEDYGRNHREAFDVVSARAVANLNMLAELCIPMVKIKGIFLAMKGSNGLEEDKAAQQAIAILGCQQEAIYHDQVAEHTHINLIYRKIKATPPKYPRMFAQMKKNPL